jgi:putative hydrolase of the HAD superfamily
MVIKNVVFDIGNVLLKWDPKAVVTELFPEHPNPQELTYALFKSEVWMDLNRGLITQNEAILIYNNSLAIEKSKLEKLMYRVKDSLTPLEGSLELLDKLYKNGIPLYSITDNVHEIMAHLKSKYDFWDKFSGVVVSAELGILKPSAEIYRNLLQQYKLTPAETLFIDDHLPNVEGAKQVGMHALQFTNAKECEKTLIKEGLLKII